MEYLNLLIKKHNIKVSEDYTAINTFDKIIQERVTCENSPVCQSIYVDIFIYFNRYKAIPQGENDRNLFWLDKIINEQIVNNRWAQSETPEKLKEKFFALRGLIAYDIIQWHRELAFAKKAFNNFELLLHFYSKKQDLDRRAVNAFAEFYLQGVRKYIKLDPIGANDFFKLNYNEVLSEWQLLRNDLKVNQPKSFRMQQAKKAQEKAWEKQLGLPFKEKVQGYLNIINFKK